MSAVLSTPSPPDATPQSGASGEQLPPSRQSCVVSTTHIHTNARRGCEAALAVQTHGNEADLLATLPQLK